MSNNSSKVANTIFHSVCLDFLLKLLIFKLFCQLTNGLIDSSKHTGVCASSFRLEKPNSLFVGSGVIPKWYVSALGGWI